MSDDFALVELLKVLRVHDYRHVAVTPATHAANLARPLDRQPTLTDIFGWNRPFAEADLPPVLWSLLQRAGAVEGDDNGKFRSGVRIASLESDLFVHSAFPTDDADSVFFGPDTYRFVRFVDRHISTLTGAQLVVDMGAGSGAGGIATVGRLQAPALVLVDVNEKALRYARINAAAAGVEVTTLQSDRVPEELDLLIGNAPYLMDSKGRSYRDGGDLLGGAVSLDWVCQGLGKLRPGRTILLYTAAAYVDGQAALLRAIQRECRQADALLTVDEIDPDVFGEQLLEPGYQTVERIAAVGLRIEVGKS